MNIEVVAEGVETVAQADLLKSQGCRLMQGYFFSKPLPPDKLAELLVNGVNPVEQTT